MDAMPPPNGDDVVTLYWGRLDDGRYYGVLPDGTWVTRATEFGILSSLFCAARRAWAGPLRISWLV